MGGKDILKKKIIAAVLTAVVGAAGVFSYTGYADDVNINFDFNDEYPPYGWESLYKNVQTNTKNRYLYMKYTGVSTNNRKYFDYIYELDSPSGVLQINYDVMYPEEVEIGGEMQLKYRSGPGEYDTQIVARVGVEYGYFRTQGKTGGLYSVTDLNGDRAVAEAGHWYSVKLTVDLENKKQTLYIFDRSNNELLVYTEASETVGENSRVNMISFSGSSVMAVDNLEIYNVKCQSMYIEGPLYAESAQKNTYYLFGKTADGKITAPPTGEATWSLENERDGVSVDQRRRLITGSSPEPGPAVIKADVETEAGTMTARQIVNVSQ